MAKYNMGYEETRKLPNLVFWLLSKNIDRLNAEEDQRFLDTNTACSSSEGYSEFHKILKKRLGNVAIFEEHDPRDVKLDRQGLDILRNMGNIN